ncbi:ImmA/IrrE family metallo-endopeptidase [Clostridium sp. 001]|uniref:ImmA/IrrE family metallo-endopeptidase n=1 Tax=Clostridium sp. 001 TaxID=1970093 RepID=UPI001C2B9E54|nr:ImmA/IrrE family metallo-endopeptidase [Clostridium sp. 001]QXE18702.1 hypothetical protein B5S50_07545 [Clostridium sp. 001]
MHELISKSIFNRSKNTYEELEDGSISFLTRYFGTGDRMIMQDDIFSVIMNYCPELKLLMYPIRDNEICGFVCNYKGQIFMYINTYLPLEKQIFTAAHELYHLKYNKEQLDKCYSHLVKSIDLGKDIEEKANLFAALLLVPTNSLKKQVELLKIDKKKLSILDIIKLMDVFAVPYKTIVLRLFEIEFIDMKKADELLEIPDRDENEGILYEINKYEIAVRWQKRTNDIRYDNLKALIIDNNSEELVPIMKAEDDIKYITRDIDDIYRELGEKID